MTTVLTNGVFDLFHSGHLRLLKYARSLGDELIVLVNCDDVVRKLKGFGRPIRNEWARVGIIRELRCVTEAHLFFQDSPEFEIAGIKPDILVKGPEETGKDIPGASIVLGYGGKVVTPNWPITESTSLTIERILTLYGHANPICM